jgi:hypothetical protein
VFSSTTFGCIKIGALLFYRRIFCVLGPRTVFKGLVTGSIVIVALWTIAYLLLAGLQCGTHFSAVWSARTTYIKYCHISYSFLLSFAISDFLLDLWILMLPVPEVSVHNCMSEIESNCVWIKIWRIHSTVKRRLSIIAVFSLALVSVVIVYSAMVLC